MIDKMNRDEVLAAIDDAVEALESDQRYYDSGALQKTRAAVSALFDEVEAIRRAAETVDAEDFDDDAIMDIADGVEGEFEGESTEPFYSFTPGQLRAFFNRMLLARAKGG